MSDNSVSKSESFEAKNTEIIVETPVNDDKPKSIWRKIDKFFQLQDVEESIRRSNKDLDPIPKDRRTWKGWQLACYWGSDMLQASALRTIISLTALGISAKMALLANTLAYILMGIILCLNARFGIRYHVPFAVQARASFGIYLSYLMVLMRLIVGGIWFGVNAYTGAECIRSMIYAIWPSFHHLHNQLPASANITTDLMVCYLIYFIISLPFYYIKQEKIQWIFTLKTILVPVAFFAMLGWGLDVTKHERSLIFSIQNTTSGSDFSWGFLAAFVSAVSSYATLAVNVNDFARYTEDFYAPYIQLIALPIFSIFTSCVGLVMGSLSLYKWGEAYWDPLLVLDRWTSRGGRAAAFFMAVIFLFSQIGVNLSANCTSAANDLNALFPRYVNIRRGQYIITILFSWAATPWNILSGAPAFLNFMNGYTIFLGPMAGVIIADIYVVHRMKYDIRELYKKDGIYRYNKLGINWRAVIAFLFGMAPQLPGFAVSVTPSIGTLSQSVQRFYSIGYLYNFPAPFVVYSVLSYCFPARETFVEAAVFPDAVDLDHDISHELSHARSPIYPEGKPESIEA